MSGVGEGRNEDGFGTHGGTVTGDDGRAAIVMAGLDGAQGHHGAFAGDAGLGAEDVGVDDALTDHDHAFIAEGRDE